VNEIGVEEWIVTVIVEAWGGDGNYTYYFNNEIVEAQFEIRSRVCAAKLGEIAIASGDLQSKKKPLYVEALYCPTPEP
jgi:hypothetical protein